MFGVCEPRHFFKLRVGLLIDTEEYQRVHDISLPKDMCSESRDLFKCWEMSDNISKMVQDRDIDFAIED